MQKKILTNEQLDALKIYQKTHSDSDTRQYFKLTYTRYHEILKLLGISKHSLSFGRGQSHKTNINNIIELQIIDYYKENANRPTYEKFHIKQKRLLEILMKHGITPHTIEENKKFGQLKLEESMYKKYGVTNYAQSVQYSKTAHKKYYYDKIYFDSSWELALWIYAKDNNKQIEHEPIRLSYIFNNKIHYYFPDFRYDGRLIEIKGCHMLKIIN